MWVVCGDLKMAGKKQINETIWVKFVGDDLEVKSVPIYELGQVLVSIQRIVHKAFLLEQDNLYKRAKLKTLDRHSVALQISERKKSSDLWGLAPFVTDPQIVDHVFTLAKSGLFELAKYSLKQVLSSKRNSKGDVIGTQLAGSIYAETVTINNQILNAGNVEKIEIYGEGDRFHGLPLITFDQSTQQYVREIIHERVLGPTREIQGIVTKIYPNRLAVDLKISQRKIVRCTFSEGNFHWVRYDTQSGEVLRFRGNSVFRLGKEDLDEFEVVGTGIVVEADEN